MENCFEREKEDKRERERERRRKEREKERVKNRKSGLRERQSNVLHQLFKKTNAIKITFSN